VRLEKLPKKNPEIPTCSMADIAFMLVIFFMLSTVFVSERGIHVALPRAVSTKKLPKKNISHIWVSSDGLVSIDDNIVNMDHVNSIMARKIRTNPDLIISILMDKEGEYGILSDAFEQLKDASALRVSMATLKEKGV
jgi:biopolymer transport protein ExbD